MKLCAKLMTRSNACGLLLAAVLDRTSVPLKTLTSPPAPTLFAKVGDAVATLVRASLNDEQRLQLADGLADAGPMELSRLFDAFEKNPSEAVGARLVEALKRSRSR